MSSRFFIRNEPYPEPEEASEQQSQAAEVIPEELVPSAVTSATSGDSLQEFVAPGIQVGAGIASNGVVSNGVLSNSVLPNVSLACSGPTEAATTAAASASPEGAQEIAQETINQSMVSYLDERVLWSGSPSQWLNFGRYFFWGMVWLGAIAMSYHAWTYAYFERFAGIQYYLYAAAAIGLLVPPLMILVWYLRLKMQKVVISYNKITESRGFTDIFRSEQFCELSDVKDIIAPPAGWLALVKRGDLIFHTSDSDQTTIHIRAMKGRHQVKQQLIPLIRRLRIERRGLVTSS